MLLREEDLEQSMLPGILRGAQSGNTIVLQDENSAFGTMEVAGRSSVRVDVRCCQGQLIVAAHLPERVPGRSAIETLRNWLHSSKDWSRWIDPVDGEVIFWEFFTDDPTPAGLDAAVKRLRLRIESASEELAAAVKAASELSEGELIKYDIERVLGM